MIPGQWAAALPAGQLLQVYSQLAWASVHVHAGTGLCSQVKLIPGLPMDS